MWGLGTGIVLGEGIVQRRDEGGGKWKSSRSRVDILRVNWKIFVRMCDVGSI